MSSMNLQRKVISFSNNFPRRLFTIFFFFSFFIFLALRARKLETDCGLNVGQLCKIELNSAWIINGEILPLRSLIAYFVDENIYFLIF